MPPSTQTFTKYPAIVQVLRHLRSGIGAVRLPQDVRRVALALATTNNRTSGGGDAVAASMDRAVDSFRHDALPRLAFANRHVSIDVVMASASAADSDSSTDTMNHQPRLTVEFTDGVAVEEVVVQHDMDAASDTSSSSSSPSADASATAIMDQLARMSTRHVVRSDGASAATA